MEIGMYGICEEIGWFFDGTVGFRDGGGCSWGFVMGLDGSWLWHSWFGVEDGFVEILVVIRVL